MTANNLTAEQLQGVLHYEPSTGNFTWKTTIKGAMNAGDIAGHCTRGYVVIGVKGRLYRAHRLAWLYMTGEWPSGHVDHINGNPSDNRWENLRDVSRHVNLQNRHRSDRDSRSGLLGAHEHGPGVWVSEIRAFGVRRYLGTFSTKEAAHAAYLAAKQQMHVDAPIARSAGPAPEKRGYKLGASGIRGVKQIGRKWSAFVHTRQGQKHLGMFDTAEEAQLAYAEAKKCLQQPQQA